MLREKAPQLADWVDNPVDQSILAGSGVSGARVLEMMLESAGVRRADRERRRGLGARPPDAIERMGHLVDRFAAIGVKAHEADGVRARPGRLAGRDEVARRREAAGSA